MEKGRDTGVAKVAEGTAATSQTKAAMAELFAKNSETLLAKPITSVPGSMATDADTKTRFLTPATFGAGSLETMSAGTVSPQGSRTSRKPRSSLSGSAPARQLPPRIATASGGRDAQRRSWP